MVTRLKELAATGQSQARIGLLEPICECDSLALAWAKASAMAELGASPMALQSEISRVMEPHAIGAGLARSVEFGNPDTVSLRDLAGGLSRRQARQLAQDVGLAASELRLCEAFSDLCEAARASALEKSPRAPAPWGQSIAMASGLALIQKGRWRDPLGEGPRAAPKLEGAVGEAMEAFNADFACKRLQVRWSIA